MIQKAEFDKLQFGDKLAQITENGELYTYKYIGRDPGWENRYAFLSGGDGSSALHYNRDFISKLFFYDCYFNHKSRYIECSKAICLFLQRSDKQNVLFEEIKEE